MLIHTVHRQKKRNAYSKISPFSPPFSSNKRPQAKCPMSVCGEYVYNMYVKNAIKMMTNSLPSPSQSPSPDQTQHGPF